MPREPVRTDDRGSNAVSSAGSDDTMPPLSGPLASASREAGQATAELGAYLADLADQAARLSSHGGHAVAAALFAAAARSLKEAGAPGDDQSRS